MPVAAGFTVGRPWTTWSLMPSFGKGSPGVLHSSSVLLWLSQNRGSGEPSPRSDIVPSAGSRALRAPSARSITGRCIAGSHDQRLRNQRWGRRWRVAASGPALRTRTAMQMSSGAALA